MMTHFTVAPVKNKDQVYTLFGLPYNDLSNNQILVQFSDTIDKLIHTLSIQNYPQIIKGSRNDFSVKY